MSTPLRLGAVAYDPKVVTIWEGFKPWFADRGLALDYVLFSNYEAQAEAQLAGAIDLAWNSPLAWVRTRRAAAAAGGEAYAVAMRDSDRDLCSVVVVRSGDGISDVADLRGRTVAVGAVDSPQATLLPLSHLRGAGLDPDHDITVQHCDVLAGKHGDHIGGERDAARALADGSVDAACLLDATHLLMTREGTLPAGFSTILTTTPPFDHCNFTALRGNADQGVQRFASLLLEQSYADAELRSLFDLEGLTAWLPARLEGYRALERAVDEAGFYDHDGRITAAGYRY
ncbi:MAG: PhnD/SsuA/transferrin family substrate-binding protein [Candidatus Dormibacteraeota bacterium]|nr:PhnD/SsuA/transferrin family substrate-binding protein [Candidatus Dormibacteraeota bacterium]